MSVLLTMNYVDGPPPRLVIKGTYQECLAMKRKLIREEGIETDGPMPDTYWEEKSGG